MPAFNSSSSFHSSVHLRIDGVSVSFPDRRVLTNVSFVVPSGERTGLIGENGSGKSTLLRIAAGLIAPDAGIVEVVGASGMPPRIGLLHQEHVFAEFDTIESSLDSATASVRVAAARVDACAANLALSPDDTEVADAYAAALEYAERVGAWDVDARVSTMLSAFGLANLPRERLVKQLSGGQRARLALAWLLLDAPDILLLDEPTNHLDDAATEHLRRILQGWRGPVLIASHDRAFLDETVTSLIDLDPAPVLHSKAASLADDGPGTGFEVTRFSGSYTDYVSVREEARARWENQFAAEQAEIKRLRASVRGSQTVGHTEWQPRSEVRAAQKYYADRNAKVVSRRVNDARSRLAELEQVQVHRPPPVLRFAGLATAPRTASSQNPGPIISAVNVGITDRLAPVSLSVSAGERWLITGANGTGKSTLLHLIAGNLSPTGGSVNVEASVRVKMLTQEVHLPDPHDRGHRRTARQTYVDLVGTHRAENVPLSTFGLLAARDENRALATLSLGQQRRLALAVVLADPPEVLVLDEPTNHFSLLLATEIEAAIPHYQGTLIIASHDRWLRKRWVDHRIELMR